MVREKKINSKSFPDAPKDVPIIFCAFPGGKCEGNTIEDTLITELKQETTAIVTAVGRHLCTVTKIDNRENVRIVKEFYECSIDSSIPLTTPKDPDGAAQAAMLLDKEQALLQAAKHPDPLYRVVLKDIIEGNTGFHYTHESDSNGKYNKLWINRL